MLTAAHRINQFRRLLSKIHHNMGLEFGFELWDQSIVPSDWSKESLAISIADEGVIASLLRGLNVTTLANLWVAKRINIINGTIFSLLEKKPKGRTRDLKKLIPIFATLKIGFYFLFISRGGPWPLEQTDKEKANTGCVDQNKKNISYHYDISNAFYQLWLDKEMVYTCGYFHDWEDNLDTIQIQKLDNLELHGFEIHDVEAWREHYQRTCRFWHDRLLANYDAACTEVGEFKTRLWLIYLAACSITFERNNCGLYQTLASKRVKGTVGLPPTRSDLYITDEINATN